MQSHLLDVDIVDNKGEYLFAILVVKSILREVKYLQVLTRAEEDQVDVIPTNAVAAHVKLFHLAMAFADGLEDLYESLVVDLVLTQVQIGQTPMIVHCTTKLRHVAVT